VRFETSFLPEHNVLTVRAQGAGDPDAVQQMVRAIRSAPEFRPGMDVLIDALSTDYLPSAQEATTFPEIFQAELPGTRLAVIVRAGGAQYSIACLVEALACRRDVQFAAFSDREEAMLWLTGQPSR